MADTSFENLTYRHYNIAILCALDKELLAVRALFDEDHKELPTVYEDTNHYALGRIGRHNVVTTCLPSDEYGTNAASEVMQNMRRSFPLEFCLLVGIGGGVPSPENDIRLGDVVVSHSNGRHPAVLQYDMGKLLEVGGFEITGILQPPPRLLMKTIGNLKSNPNPEANPLQSYIERIGEGRPEYQFPGREKDVLFAANSSHKRIGLDCHGCKGKIISRAARDSDQPEVHFGPVASGNQVMKNAKCRDRLGAKHKIICFEMEAAGVMNLIPCLVIRGICDYADSHKNKCWQGYAAAAAAAYAKFLLSCVRDYMDSNEGYTSSCRVFDCTPVSSKNDMTTKNANKGQFTRKRGQVSSSHRESADQLLALQALQPERCAEDVLQKYISFARRRPSWNPWPRDKVSLQLFQKITQWMSEPNCCLLIVRGTPAHSLSEYPAAEDFACHMIQFLRSTTNLPVLWTFSMNYDRDRSVAEELKLLISQILEVSDGVQGLALSSPPSEEQLFNCLFRILCQIKECFLVIEMRSEALAERFQEAMQRALHGPEANFKGIIISYSMQWKDPRDGSVQCAIMPSIRLHGSLPRWDVCWQRVSPQFR